MNQVVTCPKLPQEMILSVFEYLTPKGLVNAGMVSREWNAGEPPR